MNNQIQAEADHSNPATFTLNDGLLESDGWYLGRSLIEDYSLAPKCVFWHKKGDEYHARMIRKTAIDDEDGKLVIKNGGNDLALIGGKVFGDLMQSQPAAVAIRPA
ncbi:hypothetical protein N7513_002407 [Penicillium frequentans]|nr:hypothetical protein N7513_002407 [Penicillium glabrum]